MEVRIATRSAGSGPVPLARGTVRKPATTSGPSGNSSARGSHRRRHLRHEVREPLLWGMRHPLINSTALIAVALAYTIVEYSSLLVSNIHTSEVQS